VCKESLEFDVIRVKYMRDAIVEALFFTRGKSRKDLDDDRILTLALLKEIELIGEAAVKVSDKFRKSHPQVPWTLVVATRNRLIHGYFDMDLDVVWQTIKKDLPGLLRIIKTILASTGSI